MTVFSRTASSHRARGVPNGPARHCNAARAALADFSRVIMFEASQTAFFT
jgi:hypothetical protein